MAAQMAQKKALRFGSWLRRLREGKNLQQKQVVDELKNNGIPAQDLAGLTQSNLARLEAGTVAPKPEALRWLAKAYGVPEAEMMAAYISHAFYDLEPVRG